MVAANRPERFSAKAHMECGGTDTALACSLSAKSRLARTHSKGRLRACLFAGTISLLGLINLTGCATWPDLAAPPPSAQGESLRAGVGWSNLANPGDAVQQATEAALRPLAGQSPDLVLVWDNWSSRQDARDGLAELGRKVPARTIFGGHVAWPVATKWTADSSVCVVALGGGWRVHAAWYEQMHGLEREAAAGLADSLNEPEVGESSPPPTAAATQPASRLVLLFGDLGEQRANRLLAELERRLDRRLILFGGGGSGEVGSGWQYVQGRLATESVWAIRLTGPYRASSVRMAAQPNQAAVDEAALMGLTILSGDVGPEPPPWRLLLMSPSAGWLLTVKEPDAIVRRAAARIGPDTLVAGWAGDSQIAATAHERSASAGASDLAMALIVPIVRVPATVSSASQPAAGGEPVPSSHGSPTSSPDRGRGAERDLTRPASQPSRPIDSSHPEAAALAKTLP